MREDRWTCDRCETPLRKAPELFPAFICTKEGRGSTQVNVHLCQPCMNEVVEAIDPKGNLRARLTRENRGIEPTFYVHGVPR